MTNSSLSSSKSQKTAYVFFVSQVCVWFALYGLHQHGIWNIQVLAMVMFGVLFSVLAVKMGLRKLFS